MTEPLASRLTDVELADLPVAGGLDALLLGLLDTPEGRALASEPRRPARRRWPVVVAAAAAVALVITVPTYLVGRGGGSSDPSRPATQAPAATSSASPTPAPPSVDRAAPSFGPGSYALLDAPGWEIEPSSVVSLVERGVTVAYDDASVGHYFDLQWLVNDLDRDYVAEATRLLGKPDTVRILGVDADLWEDQHTYLAYLPVDDGFGLRIRARNVGDAVFRRLLADLRQVAPDEFGAALPGGTVLPAQATDFTTSMLDGTEQPDGYQPPTLVGYNAPDQAAGILAQDLGCTWARRFIDARRDGRLPDGLRAIAALRHDAHSRVVRQTSDPGYYDGLVQAMVDDRSDAAVLDVLGCTS